MALFKQDMSLLSGPPAICGGSSSIFSPHVSAGIRPVYPLTGSQEGIWVEYITDPLSTKYNLTLEWDLSHGDSSWSSVRSVLRAIRRLTERHAVLHSVITVLDGRPHIEEHDAAAADPEVRIILREASSITEQSITAILRQPFNLRTEYPAKWVLLQDTSVCRLFLVGHHIALDGGSMSILSQEFLELMGNSDAILPATIDFSRMHLFERAWRRSASCRENESFFMSQIRDQNQQGWQLQGQSAGKTRPNEYRKIQSWSTFSKEDLAAWASSFNTSWFRVAVTLVGLLVLDKTKPPLGRDETVAVAFAGRPEEFKRCVGQFANALPVQIPLWRCLLESPQSTLQSLVKAVSKNISQAKRAELFPPIDVARSSRAHNIEYQPPRVVVTYSPKLAKEECQLFPVEGTWDLFFCFLEYDKDVKLGVVYHPAVFSDSDLHDMRGQLDSLMDLSKSVTTRLADMLPWIPTYPTVPLLQLPENTARPRRHVHHWFDAHAESNPNGIALCSAEKRKSVTYGELYEASEEKAKLLQHKGVRPGDIVVLNLRRDFHVIEWLLATLKAGAAFVYLDPEQGEARREAILANCSPALVVDEQLDDMASTWVFVNNSSSDDGSQSGVESKWETKDNDLAYMVYTSGSTGEPKGVMVEHRNVASYVKATKDVLKVGFGARVLQFASFSFDASVLEWTMSLCTGACLCFAEHPKQLVGDYLADVIEQNNVTVMQITPTAFETLPLTRDLPSLRQVSVGGEAVPRKLLESWHPRIDLIHAYGPTETTVIMCNGVIEKGSSPLPEVVSLGTPNPGMAVYISNDTFTRILDRGQEGEVCIAGDQVSRGYCGKPETTAEKFRAHPANGIHVYRTGDRGMLLDDGSLVLLGRIDRELKLRGFRIAPEEVEKAIMNSGSGFPEASVHLSEDGLALEAFVAPLQSSTADLSKALKSMLPAYMIPTAFYQVESLPKNNNDKIDHKAVRAMRKALRATEFGGRRDSMLGDEEDSEIQSAAEGPGEEAAVTEVWQNVLGLSDPPRTNVNFFDIGGHSLLVPRLNDKLRQHFPGSNFRMVDLFHQSTIEQQAALVSAGKNGATKPRRQTVKKTKPSMGPPTPPSTRSASTVREQSNAPAATEASCQTPTDVAIVGMSGRFPGARDADAFYDQLLKGYNGVSESRDPNRRASEPGNTWVPRAGVLDDIESFDHSFWNLSKEEATDMDPQQRLFLEVAHEALEDAGIDSRTINSAKSARVGMFVGASQNSYHLKTESVLSDSFQREHRGFAVPAISARTAYHLNLSGPNVTVQNNCASSTVALSLAVDAISVGRCDVAVVGGVSVQLYDGGYVTKEGQIFSAKGVCRPFDSRADGTVPADAVVAVVLKRFSDAVSEKTHMYSKILGTGTGADGGIEKAGFQVPSPRGQAEVIKQAWKTVAISPEKLVYSELHGSGTPVGDALELQGLALALKELGRRNSTWTVGSVKGNIGNAQHASGLVSLVKLCKSLQNGIIPATAGLENPNSMIDPSLPILFAFEETRVGEGDVLSISAAGWGGTNSHVLLTHGPATLRKTKTIQPSPDKYNRQQLKAPPKHRVTERTGNTATLLSATTEVISRCASDIFKSDVKSHTDLREFGLDSKSYVLLSREVARALSSRPIGVAGLILPRCTPAELARVYIEQLESTPELHPKCSINVIQSGSGSTVLFLPGAGGSCAGLVDLFSALPKTPTVVGMEYNLNDMNVSNIAKAYVDALLQSDYLSSSSRLVIVGVSLGGLVAISVLAKFLKTGALHAGLRLGLVILDSPMLEHSDEVFVPGNEVAAVNKAVLVKDSGLHGLPALYVGATETNTQRDVAAFQAHWKEAIPNMTFTEFQGSHYDLWAGRNACIVADAIASAVHQLQE